MVEHSARGASVTDLLSSGDLAADTRENLGSLGEFGSEGREGVPSGNRWAVLDSSIDDAQRPQLVQPVYQGLLRYSWKSANHIAHSQLFIATQEH